LGWQLSNYVQDHFATFTIYDGLECKEGSNDITDKISDIQSGTAYFQTLGIQQDSATPYDPDPNTTGDGVRDMTLSLTIQADGITESPIYSETTTNNGEVKAAIAFCVRFSLYNADPDETNAFEINYRESPITLSVDLTDEFRVGEIGVEGPLEGQRTASIPCEAVGYECDDPDQGSEVRACVIHNDDEREGLILDRNATFYFVGDNGLDGLVTQDAIIQSVLESRRRLRLG
jgi:hypothetical protein